MRIPELVLDESKWLFTAMVLAILSVTALALRQRRHGLPGRVRILWAMGLFYGCMIGILGAGHLLAVTVKVFQGTLHGSPWLLYPLGLVLAIPAWWLVCRVGRFAREPERWGRTALALHAWLVVCLLGLGLHNWPLAAPAALNIAYQLHARRVVGWAIVTAALIINLGLFAGSVVFLASGQSFEQFKGM